MAWRARILPLGRYLARVEAMLLGMALECILKGMYIKRHRVWEGPTKAHALVKNDIYVGVKDAGDHELLQLAAAAGVTVSQPERSILTRLTDFIKYAGRYPISMRVKRAETLTNRPYQPPYARSWSLALRTIRRGAVMRGGEGESTRAAKSFMALGVPPPLSHFSSP